jgi:polysaccharide biosynthesis/export protein
MSMPHHRICSILIGLLLQTLPVLGSDDLQKVAARAGSDRYQLRPGDTIELNFPFVSAFNQTVTVQPDGYVILRVIGDVRVENQTVPELTQQLRTRYATILRDPMITIEVKDSVKAQFTVTGEVERPGKYELRGEITVAQGLAMAGGFKQGAKRSDVRLFRSGSNAGAEVVQLSAKQLRGNHTDGELRLRPGDVMFVSKSHLPALGTLISVGYLLTWFVR